MLVIQVTEINNFGAWNDESIYECLRNPGSFYRIGGKPDGNRLLPPWRPAIPKQRRHKYVAGLGKGEGDRKRDWGMGFRCPHSTSTALTLFHRFSARPWYHYGRAGFFINENNMSERKYR